jgi:hypothetical protein
LDLRRLADPVAVTALVSAAVQGLGQATVELEVEGNMVPLPSAVSVLGSGSPELEVLPVDSLKVRDDGDLTKISTSAYYIEVARIVGRELEAPVSLRGSWEGRVSVPLIGVTPLHK